MGKFTDRIGRKKKKVVEPEDNPLDRVNGKDLCRLFKEHPEAFKNLIVGTDPGF